MNLINLNITGYVFTVFAVIAIYFVINKRLSDLSRKVNEAQKNMSTLMTSLNNKVQHSTYDNVLQDDAIERNKTVELNIGPDVNDESNMSDIDDLDDLGGDDDLDDDDDLNDDDLNDDDLNDNLDDDDMSNDNLVEDDNLSEEYDLGDDDDLGGDNDLRYDGRSNIVDIQLSNNTLLDDGIKENTETHNVLDDATSVKAVSVDIIEKSIVLDNINLETIKDVNYPKLNVAELRQVIQQLGLGEEGKKLKKKEMVTLISEATK